MLFAKEILITVEESKGGGERGLRWKAVFLAILLASAVAVILGVTVAELHVMNVLNRGFHQVADPIRPLEVIEDENPPG